MGHQDCFTSESFAEKSLFLPFQFPETAHIPWLMALQHSNLLFPCYTSSHSDTSVTLRITKYNLSILGTVIYLYQQITLWYIR